MSHTLAMAPYSQLLLATWLVLAAAVLTSFTARGAADPLVVWLAPHYSGGGYSTEAYAFCSSLDDFAEENERPWRVAISQHGDAYSTEFVVGLDRRTHANMVRMANRMPRQSGSHFANAIVVCHSEPGAWNVAGGALFSTSQCPPDGAAYRIGRTMFETDRIPTGWAARCNAMDEIWVPTPFHRDIFADAGVLPAKLRVVPESVDVDTFDPARVQPYALPGPPADYKFLSVFKWEPRKGWDVLLEAFLRAFSADSPVSLYLLTRPFHGSPNFTREIHAFAQSRLGHEIDVRVLPRIFVLSNLRNDDMPRLYRAMDAFVLPSRGEGWGRPHCEAMAMGLPVLATNWSGPTAFMTDENSFPIRIRNLTSVGTGAFASHLWANVDVGHLVETMQLVQSQPHLGREKGARARETMVTRFANELVAEQLAAHVDRIFASLHPAADAALLQEDEL